MAPGTQGQEIRDEKVTNPKIPILETYQGEFGSCWGHAIYQLLNFIYNQALYESTVSDATFSPKRLSRIDVLLKAHRGTLVEGSLLEPTLKTITETFSGLVALETDRGESASDTELEELQWRLKLARAEATLAETSETVPSIGLNRAKRRKVESRLFALDSEFQDVIDEALRSSPNDSIAFLNALVLSGFISKEKVKIPNFNIVTLAGASLDPETILEVRSHFQRPNPQPLALDFESGDEGHLVIVSGTRQLCTKGIHSFDGKEEWRIRDSKLRGGFPQEP